MCHEGKYPLEYNNLPRKKFTYIEMAERGRERESGRKHFEIRKSVGTPEIKIRT